MEVELLEGDRGEALEIARALVSEVPLHPSPVTKAQRGYRLLRREVLQPAKSQRIAEKLGRLFPKLDTTPEFAWTGSFGTTGSGPPIIGRLPRHPGIFAVMGYGGNGITFSQIASEIVRSALSSRPDRDADLFAFAK